LIVLEAGFSGTTSAQDKARPIDGIEDNSFLIEEAYNQEPGVVQHIFIAAYGKNQDQKPKSRGWSMSFTQEWPVFSQEHQFSYTVPFSFIHEGGPRSDGVEDILLNYRYQALEESDKLPAIAPRFSLILPTGSRQHDKGYGVVGYDFNLPVSKKLGDRVAGHFNYGITYLPHARALMDDGHLSPRRSLVSYNLGASAIYAIVPRFHAMLEWTGTFDEGIGGEGKIERSFASILSPGFRTAVVDRDNLQVVLGFAVPIGTNKAANNYGALMYLSIEHDFLSKAGAKP
jgi:hypothetical protein